MDESNKSVQAVDFIGVGGPSQACFVSRRVVPLPDFRQAADLTPYVAVLVLLQGHGDVVHHSEPLSKHLDGGRVTWVTHPIVPQHNVCAVAALFFVVFVHCPVRVLLAFSALAAFGARAPSFELRGFVLWGREQDERATLI